MENMNAELPHTLIIDNRKKLSLTGVTDVGSFNEEAVCLITSVGEINVTGAELQVTKLDLESGCVTVEGKIISLAYTDAMRRNAGFFSKMFG